MNDTENTCKKCGTRLFLSGFCQDETCPFSDTLQDGTGQRDPVMAHVVTDDNQFDFEIDVFEVFAQHHRNGTLTEFIRALNEEGYCCGSATDSILYDLIELTTPVLKRDLDALLSYCEASQLGVNPIGFSLSVDLGDANRFIQSLAVYA